MHQHNIGYTADGFLQVWWPNQQCQSTEGGWLVNHLTVLQYYNMHADITQENNLTHTK